MTQQSAERAVTISALVVAAVYAYRRMTEGSGPPSTGSKVKQIAGEGTPAPVGAFFTAWGLAFLVISMLTEAAPGLGGSFALLVAAGDFLFNTQNVAQDVQTSVQRSKGGSSASPSSSSTSSASFGPTVGGAVSSAGNAAGAAISHVGAQLPGRANQTGVTVGTVTGGVSESAGGIVNSIVGGF